MRTIVLGAGAMGSLFGWRLKQGGYDVTLIDTWKEHVEKIKREGLKVEQSDGTISTVEIPITDDPKTLKGTYDLIIVFVKGYVTKEAVKSILHLIGKETTVITLQNGIGNANNMESIVSPDQIAVGGTAYGGGIIEPGFVAHRAWGNTYIGPFGENVEFSKLQKIAEILTECNIPTEAQHDVSSVIWSKLMINVAYNGLTSISRLRNIDFTSTPEGKDLIRGVVSEAVEVANAQGIEIIYKDPVAECIRVGLEDIAQNKSSMVQDSDFNRKTEIDNINGAIVNLGSKYGIETPYNKIVADLIKLIESRYDKVVTAI